MEVQIDSNCNRIEVLPTGATCDGYPVLWVRVLNQPGLGYLALELPDGAFGDEACPSSYGRPCLTWYGPGERYPDVAAAIAAVRDRA